MTASAGEPEPGARHDAFHRLSDQDLARAGQSNDPGRDVDGKAAVLRAEALNFPGVHPDPSVEPEPRQRPRELEAASHRMRRR